MDVLAVPGSFEEKVSKLSWKEVSFDGENASRVIPHAEFAAEKFGFDHLSLTSLTDGTDDFQPLTEKLNTARANIGKYQAKHLVLHKNVRAVNEEESDRAYLVALTLKVTNAEEPIFVADNGLEFSLGELTEHQSTKIGNISGYKTWIVAEDPKAPSLKDLKKQIENIFHPIDIPGGVNLKQEEIDEVNLNRKKQGLVGGYAGIGDTTNLVNDIVSH